MPSKSAKQHRLMAAVANNPAFAKKVGISQSVGQEFMKADKRKGKKYAMGGPTSYADSGSAGGGDMSFGEAFKAARAVAKREGRDPNSETFTWKGKKYTAAQAGEKKAAPKVEVQKTETKVEMPTSSGARGYRGSKPGSARVGSGRYDDPTSSFGERVTAPIRALGDIFGRRREEGVMRNMGVDRAEAARRLANLDKVRESEGMKGGGHLKKYKSGGSVSSASKRADGIARKGKTKGRIC